PSSARARTRSGRRSARSRTSKLPSDNPTAITGPLKRSRAASTPRAKSANRSGESSRACVPCPGSTGASASSPTSSAAFTTHSTSYGVPPNPCSASTWGVPPRTKSSLGGRVPVSAPRRELTGARAPSQSTFAPLDAIRPYLLVQVRPLDAENDRGLGDVPVELLQRLHDVAPFGRFAVLPEREPTRSRALLGRGTDGWLRIVFERARVRVFGQVGDGDRVFRQNRGALDHVLQLANVARPGTARERVVHRRVDALGLEAVLAAKRGDERVREQRDVFGTFAQRGNAQRKNVQAKQEIFAESAVRDGS